MRWRFGTFTLDPDRAELLGPGGPVRIERYPFDVLMHLVSHRDRVVTRDELLDTVWGGRIVSEATISTAIKQARRAVGDSGSRQSTIKTVHGRGFRFVAPVIQEAGRADVLGAVASDPVVEATEIVRQDVIGAGRPSIAVLRFVSVDESEASIRLTSAFPAELISGISRIGWLHLIARATSIQFDPVTASMDEIGRILGVRYLVSGLIEKAGDAVTISVELLSTWDGSLVWADRFATNAADIQIGRNAVVSSITAALETTISANEAWASRRLSEREFDAWSHFHLGLAHMYKFNAGDNLIASQHFQAAIERDPEFARAHAGLSFTHWQNAFMQYGDDRRLLLDRAFRTATHAFELDPNEPFASFNLGRARWLEGDLDSGMDWMQRSLKLNPNSAQAHYNEGLLKLLTGAPDSATAAASTALSLSPLDPLLYAMQGTRAMAAIMNEDFAEAQRLGEAAARAPGAHFFIFMIAAATSELNEQRLTAEIWMQRALQTKPDADSGTFFRAFPSRDDGFREKMTAAFTRLGV